jgi:amino acid adenylation domain-containing protein
MKYTFMALDRLISKSNNDRMGWDDTDLDRSVIDRFERVARQYPHRLAVKTHEQQLTYDELNQAANRLAHRIVTVQGTSNEPVAILMDQGAAMIIAILGVLKAGKVYVPLDPSNSAESIQSILVDCQAKCIVTNNAHKPQQARCTQIINLDELDANICTDNLPLPLTPDTLSSIIYTSGSTGVPKGVLQDHKYILRIVRTYSEDVDISPNDRLILLFSLTSNGSHGNLFGALLNGATIYCLDLKKGDMARLATWLRRKRITIYYSSVSVFRSFAESLQDGEIFPDVRIVQLSAEPVLPSDVELCRRHFAFKCVFINRFGTTEVGPFLQYRLELSTPFIGDLLPVGFPINGMRVHLVDNDGRQVGPDTTGELVVQSRYLSLGYWEKPELTATKFLPDPEGGDQRLYLTGDLGRMTADGCFFHVGRKDFEVKIRGYRVNTGEVERMMLAHPGIKQAAVLSQTKKNNETYLAAYYVPAHNAMRTGAELRTYLRDRLPEYMVPSAFVKLDVLPMAPSGKVDRCALASLQPAKVECESFFVAARTPIEETLAEIWTEILGTERVGIHDNFLALGGHSLNAFQIIARVRAIFGVELSIQSLIDANAATIAVMAEWIEQAVQSERQTSTAFI